MTNTSLFFLITLFFFNYHTATQTCQDISLEEQITNVKNLPNIYVPVYLSYLAHNKNMQEHITMFFNAASSNPTIECSILQNLLEQGAHINYATQHQRDPNTALSWAAYHNNYDLVYFLLKNGANVTTVDHKNKCALFFALSTPYKFYQCSSQKNTINGTIIELLEEFGANAVANTTVFSCIIEEIEHSSEQDNTSKNRKKILITTIEKSLIKMLPTLLDDQNHCIQLINCAQNHNTILRMFYSYGFTLDKRTIKNLELQENAPEHLYKHAICGTLTASTVPDNLNEDTLIICFKHALLGNYKTLHTILLTLMHHSTTPLHILTQRIKISGYKNSSEFFTALITWHFKKPLQQQKKFYDTLLIFKRT